MDKQDELEEGFCQSPVDDPCIPDDPDGFEYDPSHLVSPRRSSIADLDALGQSDLTSWGNLIRAWEFQQLLVIAAAFFLTFSAWHSSQNLQTSLNLGDVDGHTNLSITYLCIMVSSLFGPPVVHWFGSKQCLLLGYSMMLVYMVTMLWPQQYTVYPASALFGLSAAPLWVAQGEYTTWLAVRFSRDQPSEQQAIIGLFNGVFFCIFETTQVVGNGISSLVFHVSPKQSGDGNGSPAASTVRLLFVLFCGFVVCAILLVTFKMDSRRTDATGTEPKKLSMASRSNSFSKMRRSSYSGKLRRLTEASRLMLEGRTMILIPLMIANGLARSLVFSDFTSNVIKPHLGEDNIGFVMMLFGFTDAIASLYLGKLAGQVGRTPILLAGSAMHLSCLCAILWMPLDSYSNLKIYAISACWGLADGAWYTMIPAHIGAKFLDKPEAAFSAKTLWEAAAAATLFEVGDRISLQVKGIAVIAAVGLGTLGFVISVSMKESKPLDAYDDVEVLHEPHLDSAHAADPGHATAT